MIEAILNEETKVGRKVGPTDGEGVFVWIALEAVDWFSIIKGVRVRVEAGLGVIKVVANNDVSGASDVSVAETSI